MRYKSDHLTSLTVFRLLFVQSLVHFSMMRIC